MTATAIANDTSASRTDPPVISSTRCTTGSMAFLTARGPSGGCGHRTASIFPAR
jgi:hypothetical protein